MSPFDPDHAPGQLSTGTVTRVTLPNGAVRMDVADAAGRMVRQVFPDGETRAFDYDDAGNLVAVRDGAGRVFARYERTAAGLTATNPAGRTTVLIGADGAPAGIEQQPADWSAARRCEVTRDAEGLEVAWRYPDAAAVELERQPDGSRRLRAGLRHYLDVRCDTAAGQSEIRLASGITTVERLAAEGRVPRLTGLSIVGTGARFAWAYEHDTAGRIIRADAERYAYDDAGRVRLADIDGRPQRFTHDASGRLRTAATPTRCARITYASGPMPAGLEEDGAGQVRFDHDARGRRVARHDAAGTTRYAYDLMDQLVSVTLPTGERIRYRYDGFGRLVARGDADGWRHFLVDHENRRVAAFEGAGRLIASYLWLGQTCVARLNGPVGRPIAVSYHKAHGGRMVAHGDAAGHLRPLGATDVFGRDATVTLDDPGYAGLFGDPATGLLLAGARWLDRGTAAFLTPDSWFGTVPDRAARRRLARVLKSMPGGTDRLLTAETAYQWCALDPVNAVDANGHNWLGLIFTTISALLWQMQLTSVALQMEAINIIVEVILALAGVFGLIGASGWLDQGFRDFYWRWSIFNLAPPAASYTLMVPFSLWLNGVMKIQPSRAWTLGSIVWERGSDFRDIGEAAARDLIVTSAASGFVSATSIATASVFLARNAATAAGGTYDNTGAQEAIRGIAIGTGAALGDVYGVGDELLVEPAGGGDSTVTRVTATAAPDLEIAPPLPAALNGQPVNLVRLDQGLVRLDQGSRRIARALSFIAGDIIHLARQIPEGFPTAGLTITEFLPAADQDARAGVAFPDEMLVLRAESGTVATAFSAGDPIRLTATGVSLARRVTDVRDDTDILLDEALTGGPFPGLAVTEMTTTGATANGQSLGNGPGGADTRLTAAQLTDFSAGDGVEIGNTGAATAEARMVTTVLVDATIAPPLPAGLQGVAVEVDRMVLDAGTQTTGTITNGGNAIDVATGTAGDFAVDNPVRLTGGGQALAYVTAVDATAHRLSLRPPTGLADGTAVTVTLLERLTTFPAEQVSAPGDHVLIQPDRASRIAANQFIQVRATPAGVDPELRQVAPDPVVTLDLTEAPAGGTTAGLDVTRLIEQAGGAQLSRANVVTVHTRLDFGAAPPYAVGEQVLIAGAGELTIAGIASVTGNVAVLDQYQEFPATTPVDTSRVEPTGQTAADATLDEALVMRPADPDGDPLTRQRALQFHEMRHVFQEALWGPFFISMPIPWLFHLGFNIAGDGAGGNAASKIIRHVSLGGIDSLIALLVWGIGGAEGETTVQGVLQDDRRRITFADDIAVEQLERFAEGHRIDVRLGDADDFNIVDTLNAAGRELRLRFPANASRFPQGATLTLNVSRFEQIRRDVQLYFSFNLEQLWAEYIPTGWGRALSSLLNRDSWFPGIGLYLLGFYVSGGDDRRSPFEQDAAFHSGDLYTDIPLARPTEVFVGEFARIYGFIQARYGGVSQSGTATRLLTVERPAGVPVEAIAGGVDAGGNRVRLRENWLLPLHPRVENAVAALFAASEPGEYVLQVPNRLTEDVVLAHAMPTGFTEEDRVTVRALSIEPPLAQDIFETEHVDFRIRAGDSTATYAMRFPPGAAGTLGTIDGLAYTAPLVAPAANVTQDVEITATYPAGHAIFSGPGQDGPARLTADQRTNLATRQALMIRRITAPAVGPVAAGANASFQTPIAPREAVVTSAMPAGASVNARVTIGTGRPATLTFFAPDAVTAATNVTVELRFGRDPTAHPTAPQLPLTLTVNVTP